MLRIFGIFFKENLGKSHKIDVILGLVIVPIKKYIVRKLLSTLTCPFLKKNGEYANSGNWQLFSSSGEDSKQINDISNMLYVLCELTLSPH